MLVGIYGWAELPKWNPGLLRGTVFALPLLLSACAVPPATEPDLELPSAWQSRPSMPAHDVQDWIASLNDAQLPSLIVEALQENHDLAAAAARVAAARAQARLQGASLWPQAAIGVDAARSRRSSASGFALASPVNDSRSANLELSWEADLWGRLAAGSQAGRLDAEAAGEDYAAARLSLAGNVAGAWFDAIHAQGQLSLAELTALSFRRHMETIEDRALGGLSTVLDLRLIRAQVASADSAVARQRELLQTGRRRLEILLGRYPAGALALPGELPAPGMTPETGVPVTLLERRPDLRAARSRLLARHQDASGAARNILPQFVLNASGGRSGASVRDLLDADYLVWTIAGALTQPLFRGGALLAERELADAQLLLAAEEYAAIALRAMEEVESALTAEQLLAEREAALRVARDEATVADELALEQYTGGLVDIITLLEAERRLVDARSGLLAVRNERLQNRVRLHLALGGDFGLPGEQAVARQEEQK